jgi:hypothetical protein
MLQNPDLLVINFVRLQLGKHWAIDFKRFPEQQKDASVVGLENT